MELTTRHRAGRRIWLPIALVLVLLMLLGACGDDDDDSAGGSLSVTDAWSRPAVLLDESEDDEMDSADGETTAGEDAMDDDMDMGGGTNGVIYMTVENDGDADDVLVSASTDIAGTAEIHTVNMVEGVMQMRQVEGGIEIPAGETIVLEPGGLHVMLIGLNQSLETGDSFDVDLAFEVAGSMTVEVEVREP